MLHELMVNPRFLAAALLRRGAQIDLIDIQEQVFVANLNGERCWFIDVVSQCASAVDVHVARDKMLTKRHFIAAGLNTPIGNRFDAAGMTEAMVFAGIIGFPVVLKPLKERQGRGVRTGIASMAELEAAAWSLLQGGQEGVPAQLTFLVEKQHQGQELRVWLAKDGRYAAVQREPAYVVGDGSSTIIDLVMAENERRLNPRTTCLGEIVVSERELDFLHAHKRNAFEVPQPGEKISLLGFVDGQAAIVTDVTDEVHSSIVMECAKAMGQFPSLDCIGFDILVDDLTESSSRQKVLFIEANVTPALGLHLAPGVGGRRDVANVLVEQCFPSLRRAPFLGGTSGARELALAPIPMERR